MLIRQATAQDINFILEIEALSIPNPYNQRQFLEELGNKDSYFLVTVDKGKVIAYLLYHLVLDEIELIKIVVHPDFQRQGIGKKLFYQILSLYPRIKKVNLEVRESNQNAIQFYEKLGFKQSGLRKQYYSNGENAIQMSCLLDTQTYRHTDI